MRGFTNDLNIYYVKNKDNCFIESIYYKDECLAYFRKSTQTIDLSVLYPFITKSADFFKLNVETNEKTHKEVIVSKIDKLEDGSLMVFLEDKNAGES